MNVGASRLLLLTICYTILSISSHAISCETIFYVDPKGRDSGTFYVVKNADNKWHRRGYLQAGTLVLSDGLERKVSITEELFEDDRIYVPFVSEFGQTGYLQWDDIKHGSVANLHGAKIAGTGSILDCNSIERFVAPDSSASGFNILKAPDVRSEVADTISASFIASVFVLNADYSDRVPGGKRFLKVHYRVRPTDPIRVGFIDRKTQTTEAIAGVFRLTDTVQSVREVIRVTPDKQCNGRCWPSIFSELYESIVNFEIVGDALAEKPCGVELTLKFSLSGDAEAKASIAGWFNIGVAGGATTTLEFKLPSGEVSTTGRLYKGDKTEVGIQRTHTCVGSQKGPAKFIGLRFSGYDKPAQIVATDL